MGGVSSLVLGASMYKRPFILAGILIGLMAGSAQAQCPAPAPTAQTVVVYEVHEFRSARAVARVVFLPVRVAFAPVRFVGRALFGGCR
jgi:hypothetical protein